MAAKTSKAKAKRLSKGQRIHVRRLKQAARNEETNNTTKTSTERK
jgi:hypothetical protein